PLQAPARATPDIQQPVTAIVLKSQTETCGVEIRKVSVGEIALARLALPPVSQLLPFLTRFRAAALRVRTARASNGAVSALMTMALCETGFGRRIDLPRRPPHNEQEPCRTPVPARNTADRIPHAQHR